MVDELDFVARYAREQGLAIRPRTVLVEGTRDVELLKHAAELERKTSGLMLIDEQFSIVAAGEGPRGGANGVVRELIALRSLGRHCFLPNGRARYRFVALVDNDDPGRVAVHMAKNIDTSIVEYHDLFRLRPVMPIPSSLDPRRVEQAFDAANAAHGTLNWELEDLLGDRLFSKFAQMCPDAILRTVTMGERVHRELRRESKASLHGFVEHNATRSDVEDVVTLIKALRNYLGLKSG